MTIRGFCELLNVDLAIIPFFISLAMSKIVAEMTMPYPYHAPQLDEEWNKMWFQE